jgi:Sec-independent protein translocase protein TatA
MFGIGFWEVVVVAIVALLLLGPQDFPRIARMLGAALRKLQRTYTWIREAATLVDPTAPEQKGSEQASDTSRPTDTDARDAQNRNEGG